MSRRSISISAGAPAELAAELLAELELDGGRQEVGYPGGQRTVFHSIAEDVVIDPAREAGLANLVVLATGGARGITAEVLRELARPGNVLVLTGRSALVEIEADDISTLVDADALRKHFFAQVRSGALKLTPGEINRRVQGVLDQREMRANVADFRAAGATVEYHAVDVTDDSAIGALIADIAQRHGPINGVVHGAGVIEDKRLADKRSDSWSRVVETKIIGLLALQKHVDPAALKFFTVFSSVAGRYGNSGQSDYATANELMNRLCMQLQARWGEGVAVSALCWGPWGATRFGAGMVTAETEAKFAEKGVSLVSAALGRRLFRQELVRVAGTPVEVICGEAPWESREAELGRIRQAPPAPMLGPLLGNGVPASRPTGERIVPGPPRSGASSLSAGACARRQVRAAGGCGARDHGRSGTRALARLDRCRSARAQAAQGRGHGFARTRPAGLHQPAAVRQQRGFRSQRVVAERPRQRPRDEPLSLRRPHGADVAGADAEPARHP